MHPFVVSCVRAQVDAVLSEIRRIQGSEFPYSHSEKALKETNDVFESHRDSLACISEHTDRATAELACSTAFVDLSESVDLLGFLLRSTNVRNAFEAYGPMLRIARQLLCPDTRLIISSEWHFSPFTYVGYHYLPGFVLIGLPAPESSNPFLLPLAGHELGHSAWPQYGLDKEMEKSIELEIIRQIEDGWDKYKDFFHNHKVKDVGTDLFARSMWKTAWNWALRQCEEHFCDLFGLRIFGEAYLYAFAYLLAPERRGIRPVMYPNLRTRAKCLADAGLKYGLTVPEWYADQFEDLKEPPPENQREFLLLSLADAAHIKFVDFLQSKADQIVANSGLEPRSPALVKSCRDRLTLMVPAEGSKGLANILNAAWQGWLDLHFFRDAQHNNERLDNLREVVLKSIEVYEIETRLEETK